MGACARPARKRQAVTRVGHRVSQTPDRVLACPSEDAPAAVLSTDSGLRYVPGVCLTFIALSWAFRQSGPWHAGRFWDDALFFRRVAYNIVHHGVAAWNVVDGPVFMSTSQLYQLISVGLVSAFPAHYNAAAIFWSALCISLSWWLLWRAMGAGLIQGLAGFVLLSAPSVFFTIGTGMETSTVLLVVCASALASLRESRLSVSLALQLTVYLARPDAAILSLITGAGLLVARGKSRAAIVLALSTLVGVGLLSLVFLAYYGTPVPLAAYLKITPVSAYDEHYLTLGLTAKLDNLALTAVTLAVMAPLVACRLDRTNLVLCIAGTAFVAYHGLTTNEIMGYHARFYAPALPIFVLAALRGLDAIRTTRKKQLVVAFGAAAAGLVGLAFALHWIERTVGRAGSENQYIVYAAGTPFLGLLLLLPPQRQKIYAVLLTLALSVFQIGRMAPPAFELQSDAESDFDVYSTNNGQVGIEVIKACFPEPLQLMHSELGIPGALLPESRILDYTGLANPAVAKGTFDFEQICSIHQPGFIFRPHTTHERLNRKLDSSECLAKNYALAPLDRCSSCPLYVRNDLIAHYNSCGMRVTPIAEGARDLDPCR
jgi:hypothetical protein